MRKTSWFSVSQCLIYLKAKVQHGTGYLPFFFLSCGAVLNSVSEWQSTSMNTQKGTAVSSPEREKSPPCTPTLPTTKEKGPSQGCHQTWPFFFPFLFLPLPGTASKIQRAEGTGKKI